MGVCSFRLRFLVMLLLVLLIVSFYQKISLSFDNTIKSIWFASELSHVSDKDAEKLLDMALLDARNRSLYSWSVKSALNRSNQIVRLKGMALYCCLNGGDEKCAKSVLTILTDTNQNIRIRKESIALSLYLDGSYDDVSKSLAEIIRSESTNNELREISIEALWSLTALTTNIPLELDGWMQEEMNRRRTSSSSK